MTEEITPALSAEEWQVQRIQLAGSEVAYVSTRGMMVIEDDDYYLRWTSWFVDSRRHGVAALCLYQQSFGFTQDDVGFLLGEASAAELAAAMTPATEPGELMRGLATIEQRRLRELASRIAALLPPEVEK